MADKPKAKDVVLRIRLTRSVAVPKGTKYPHAEDGIIAKDTVIENPSPAEAALVKAGIAEDEELGIGGE